MYMYERWILVKEAGLGHGFLGVWERSSLGLGVLAYEVGVVGGEGVRIVEKAGIRYHSIPPSQVSGE